MATRLLEARKIHGESCSFVFQLLDNSLYMARTEEGGLIPARRELHGGYPVDSRLVLAPQELQYNYFVTLKPLLEAARMGRRS